AAASLPLSACRVLAGRRSRRAALRKASACGSLIARSEHSAPIAINKGNTAKGGAPMSSFTLSAGAFAGGILAGLMGAAATAPAAAQQKAAPPDFSSNQVGWIGVNGGGPGFEPVPGRLPPVSSDPAHPFVPNGAGRQPTYRIADLTNPNLKPWVKEHMKKDNDEVLAGKIAFTARSSCMPAGVPGFMAYGGANPVYFVQTPKQIWMVYSGDAQVRRIYLDVPHSEHPT